MRCKNGFEVRLEMIVQSHLNDLPYDSGDDFSSRLKFIKTIIFHNPNLNVGVTLEYVQWIWSEVENDRYGCSFEEFEEN